MAKVRKEILERTIREGIVDTPTYRYIARNANTPEYQYLMILRKPLTELGRLPETEWELIATSFDGKTFIRTR